MNVKISFEKKTHLYILLDVDGVNFKEILPKWCIAADPEQPDRLGLIAPFVVLEWVKDNLGISLQRSLSNVEWENLSNGKTTYLEMV